MALVRKQVYLDPAQDRRIKRRARSARVPEAEILRRALDIGLDRMGDAEPATPSPARKTMLGFIDGLIRQGPVAGGRTWRRDDLYERGVRR